MMITREYELFTIAVVDFVFFERERNRYEYVSKRYVLIKSTFGFYSTGKAIYFPGVHCFFMFTNHLPYYQLIID